VDELTVVGDRPALGGVVRGAAGVTHAEAHAVMLSEEDVHRVLGSLFFVVRCSFFVFRFYFVAQSDWVAVCHSD
jgi:hypothetical protein